VMASWGYNLQSLNIFINGTLDVEKQLNVDDAALMDTIHEHDIGLDRNKSSALHAYLRDLIVYENYINKPGRPSTLMCKKKCTP